MNKPTLRFWGIKRIKNIKKLHKKIQDRSEYNMGSTGEKVKQASPHTVQDGIQQTETSSPLQS